MDSVVRQPLRFGLSEAILTQLHDTFVRCPDVEQVWLYGSRATGTYRPQSDIDLAVNAPGMTGPAFAQLWNALDDLPIIFKLDVLHWESASPALRHSIALHGVALYCRQK